MMLTFRINPWALRYHLLDRTDNAPVTRAAAQVSAEFKTDLVLTGMG